MEPLEAASATNNPSSQLTDYLPQPSPNSSHSHDGEMSSTLPPLQSQQENQHNSDVHIVVTVNDNTNSYQQHRPPRPPNEVHSTAFLHRSSIPPHENDLRQQYPTHQPQPDTFRLNINPTAGTSFTYNIADNENRPLQPSTTSRQNENHYHYHQQAQAQAQAQARTQLHERHQDLQPSLRSDMPDENNFVLPPLRTSEPFRTGNNITDININFRRIDSIRQNHPFPSVVGSFQNFVTSGPQLMNSMSLQTNQNYLSIPQNNLVSRSDKQQQQQQQRQQDALDSQQNYPDDNKRRKIDHAGTSSLGDRAIPLLPICQVSDTRPESNAALKHSAEGSFFHTEDRSVRNHANNNITTGTDTTHDLFHMGQDPNENDSQGQVSVAENIEVTLQKLDAYLENFAPITSTSSQPSTNHQGDNHPDSIPYFINEIRSLLGYIRFKSTLHDTSASFLRDYLRTMLLKISIQVDAYYLEKEALLILNQDHNINNENTLSSLPDELCKHVFSFLDGITLAQTRLVCKKWNKFACDESLWKRLCLERWRSLETDPAVWSLIDYNIKYTDPEKWRRIYPSVFRGQQWKCRLQKTGRFICQLVAHHISGASLGDQGLPYTLIVERRFNILHLQSFVLPEASLLYFEPETEEDRPGFEDFIDYLTQRTRAGLALEDQRRFIFIPPCEFTENLNYSGSSLLGIVQNAYPPLAP